MSSQLDKIRHMPDSRAKLYKILAIEGSSKTMQAAAREYARMAIKGYRP